MNARRLAAQWFAVISSFDADDLLTAMDEVILGMWAFIKFEKRSIILSFIYPFLLKSFKVPAVLAELSRKFSYLHPKIPPLWIQWVQGSQKYAASKISVVVDVEADDSIFQESTFQVETASPTVILKPEVDEKLKGL